MRSWPASHREEEQEPEEQEHSPDHVLEICRYPSLLQRADRECQRLDSVPERAREVSQDAVAWVRLVVLRRTDSTGSGRKGKGPQDGRAERSSGVLHAG